MAGGSERGSVDHSQHTLFPVCVVLLLPSASSVWAAWQGVGVPHLFGLERRRRSFWAELPIRGSSSGHRASAPLAFLARRQRSEVRLEISRAQHPHILGDVQFGLTLTLAH
ncbi:unnamed protein product [Prorocentrum cordatum]|uniref:Transmembrane protein 231 n=1 Tax=Prorocentrum cordatum TaxID=2364126 RepID=A0ABN9QPA2_9DINO|nr:unnamed protein product [Polarella glacialis]